MSERSRATDDDDVRDANTDKVVETADVDSVDYGPDDHVPSELYTGYDPFGHTRVGIGSAGGDVRKLVRHNEGRHQSDGNHSAREAARDKKRITESFCSYLDVPSHQQQEAIAAMGKMNLDRFGSQKRLEKVALAAIKVVVERDRFHRLRRTNLRELDEELLPTRMLDDERYCDLLDEHNVSRKDVYSISQLVKRELKKRNHFVVKPNYDGTSSRTEAESAATD